MQNGSDRLLYLYNTDDFYPIGCLTSNSFSERTDTLDATMRSDTNGWMQVVPVGQSYNLSFSGMLSLDDRGSTIMTYEDVKTLKRARTKVNWKIISSEGDSEEGSGYIVSLSNTASVNDFVTFDGEIVGVGEPASTAWTPPENGEIESMIPPYEAAKA